VQKHTYILAILTVMAPIEKVTKERKKRKCRSLEGDLDASDEAAKCIKLMRTQEDTVYNYNNLIKHVIDYFRNNRPELMGADGEIIMPLSTEAVIQYFGHLMRPAYLRAKLIGPQELTEATSVAPFSSTYLGSYRSAIVDLYRLTKTTMPDDLNLEWKGMLKGTY
jgi:hypothetical protein